MKHPLLALAALLFALGSPTNLLLAVDYYVSGTGSDATGDGSSGAPWRTITKVLTEGVASGDTIHVQKGTYSAAEGETFPLVIPSGVAVEGSNPDTTVVNGNDGAMAGNPTFECQSGIGSTSISGLSVVDGVKAGDNLFQVEAASGQVTIEGNELSGGAHGIQTLGSGADNAQLSVVGNTISGFALAGVQALYESGLVSPLLFVASNEITGAGAGNDVGIHIGLQEDGFVDLGLFGNTVSSCGSGLLLQCSQQETGRFGALSASVISNRFENNTMHGAMLSVGVQSSMGATTSASVTMSLTMAANEFVDNAMHGLFVDIETKGGPGNLTTVVLSANGNTITGNGGDGVLLLTSRLGSAVTSHGGIDFGQAVSLGLNTISGNFDDSTPGSTVYDIRCMLDGSLTIPARGNWWGSASSAVVESHLYHGNDDPQYALLSVANSLSSTLTFTAVPDDDLVPGMPVAVTATDGSIFIPLAGTTSIGVTVGGVAATSVVAGTTALLFAVPSGAPSGHVPLTITNPGGQSGTVTVDVEESDSGEAGGCFVATATMGGYDSPEVRLLRRFRDEFLVDSAIGRNLVAGYYASAPALADAVAHDPRKRAAARVALMPVLGAARLLLDAPWALLGVILALSASRLRPQERVL